jgi:hypothetical protein
MNAKTAFLDDANNLVVPHFSRVASSADRGMKPQSYTANVSSRIIGSYGGSNGQLMKTLTSYGGVGFTWLGRHALCSRVLS